MTNIDLIGIDKILQHIPKDKKYRTLASHELVKQDDLICMVSISNMYKKEFSVSWIKPETIGEIGKERKYSGQIVIRQYGK